MTTGLLAGCASDPAANESRPSPSGSNGIPTSVPGGGSTPTGGTPTGGTPTGGTPTGGTPTGSASENDPRAASTGVNGAAPEASAPGGKTKAAAGAPAQLQMPTIGFDKAVTKLGLNAKGEINPPAGVVQWYDKSVSPGQPGISVIAGHVLYNGPDVFYKLDKLNAGDVVTVTYGNGAKKQFRVYAEEAINKKDLQKDPRVWGTSSTPVLALITCDSGSQVVQNHHVDNYVVWAKPI